MMMINQNNSILLRVKS